MGGENSITAGGDYWITADISYDWRHYLSLIERKPGALRNGAPFDGLPVVLQQLRKSLIKRPGGDRLMAEVLACVPQHGLEPILVAVELILESGNTSAEHIKNILSRLKEPPRPDPLDTALTVEEAPIADAGRYDRLHAEAHHA